MENNIVIEPVKTSPTTTIIEQVVSGITNTEATAQKQPENAPASEPKSGEKPKADYSQRLAKLKEREAAIAAREAELAELQSGLTEKEKAVINSQTFAEDLKKNPIKALEAAGLTFEQLAEAVLSQDSSAQTQAALEALGKKIQDLEEFKTKAEREREEAEIKAKQDYIDRVVSDFKDKSKTFITSKPDDYELIILNDAFDLVYDVVEEYWEEHEKILDLSAAANAVEKWLEDRGVKLLQAKKIQTKIKPRNEPAKTLTSQIGSIVPPADSDGAILPRDVSVAKAAKLLRFT